MKLKSKFSDENFRSYLNLSKKPFGRTGWNIPVLSFGGASLSGEGGGYGFGHVSEQVAEEIVDYAFDLGIKLFDSAPIYGYGLSEQRLGKYLKSRRDQVYLTSKSGVTWHGTKRVNLTNDPKVAEMMLLQSLKDLSTDYIDLYFIHWPDESVDIRRPLEVLAQYQRRGAITHIGLCNTNISDLRKASEVARIEVVQSEYNLFNRHTENEIFHYCRENQTAFMSWGPLDKGVLTGNYDLKRTYDDVDARKSAPWFKKSDMEKKFHCVEKLKLLLPESLNMTELLFSFYQAQESLNTILIGAKSIEQWQKIGEALMNGTASWSQFKHQAEWLNQAAKWQKSGE